jgi:ATP-dependent DNA ligase
MPKPGFVEPMECVASDKVPERQGWLYEIKLDSYRTIAVRGANLEIYSRLKNSVTGKFPQIAAALDFLPQKL